MRVLGKWIRPVAILVLVVGAYAVWRSLQPAGLPEGIASGNGRIEATEIDIATKTAGRVREIRAREGDFVTAGQTLAVMDTDQLQAQRRQAVAQLEQARIAIQTAESQVAQRQAERASAAAVLTQREAERDAAASRFERSQHLVQRDNVSRQVLDDDRARSLGAVAAVEAGKAQLAAADAAISATQSQVVAARSSVDAAQATIDRIDVDITDSTLTTPRAGRVQFRVAQPGEVLGAGGRVLNIVDLEDVYMTFFLPTDQAGRVALGADARIVLDAAPEMVLPAKISFVADVAQFTPKTVETQVEREKLMFRVRAQIPPELLRKYIQYVKTGLPGVAYVKTSSEAEWPTFLQETVQP